ncbi:hypothetical protein ACHQM5_002480 [Ranunculus cassubicifolius]
MSGGTPVSGGLMRQRHSQGYASSGDDLEDDACSRPPPPPPIHRARTWTELAENLLWIASAFFIIYYGDRNSNFIYVLCHDHRITRPALYFGMVGVFLNVGIFSYMNLLAWGIRKTDEKLEMIAPSVAPLVTMVGIVSFCLFSIALWPIWSFLSLPLLFTLFMACMVISPYMMFGKLRQPIDVFRTD